MFIKIAPSVLVLGAGLLVGVGCETSADMGPETPAQRTERNSARLDSQAKMMRDGEKMVADGRSQREKGLVMREQGQTIDAERQIAEGDSKVRQGQMMIDEANRRMRMTLNQQQQTLDASQASYREMQQSDEMQKDRARRLRESTTQPSMRHDTNTSDNVNPPADRDTTTNQP
jgi:hypothetical protein